MFMRILITGGVGFIGSNLALELKKADKSRDIICIDNLRRRGSELNLQRLEKGKVNFIHGDIRNREDLEVISHIDSIVECSAEVSVTAGHFSPPGYTLNTNLVGTLNCLEYARKQNASLLFLSTSRVYPTRAINSLKYAEMSTRFTLSDNKKVKGVSSRGFSEEFNLEGTRTLYGATKLCSELIIQEYVEMYGLKAVINRCGVIAGPWQMGKVDQGLISYWVARHHYKQPLSYIGYGGKGKQVRDILNVRDLCRLIEIEIKNTDAYDGQIYNVGGGLDNSVSLLELTQLCQKYTGNKVKIIGVKEERVGDVKLYLTDNRKVTKRTRWVPEITVEQTVKETAEWIKVNSEILRPILS